MNHATMITNKTAAAEHDPMMMLLSDLDGVSGDVLDNPGGGEYFVMKDFEGMSKRVRGLWASFAPSYPRCPNVDSDRDCQEPSAK